MQMKMHMKVKTTINNKIKMQQRMKMTNDPLALHYAIRLPVVAQVFRLSGPTHLGNRPPT